ncbi:MAG: YerC/YecD family TrpR-related protein [Acutalibacteraceae bacterium]
MSLPRNKHTDELFESILLLKSVDECYKYFEDLCTVKEVQAFSQRLEVAKLLDKGSSYQQAVETTGVSSATIGRVKHCLDYGAGGYGLILERLKESGKENADKQA